MMWSGSIVAIPTDWVLCDGNNGTPDLRDKFVVAAGDVYSPDDEGGEVNHDHTFTTDIHSHSLPAGNELNAGLPKGIVTNETVDSGTTDEASLLPPFYSLAYIMYQGES